MNSIPWIGLGVAFMWSVYNLLRKKIRVDTDIGLLIESLFILPIIIVTLYFIIITNNNDFNSIKNVIDVIEFDDKDKTCINGIKIVLEKYKNYKILFANGGDRNTETTPEKDFCIRNKIETLWSVGGDFKKNSSSKILEKWKE